MAKIKINFNNAEYNIDESAFASAAAELSTHLSTTMSGSGAKVEFGGMTYNIDSTKLSTATTDFVTYLGTIAGSGKKVMVNGVEYSVSSEKVADALTNFEAALGELENGGSEPELGFPIAWNSMEVVGNPTIQIDNRPYVKISDYCPTEDEIYNSQFTIMPNAVDLPSGTQIFETSEWQDNYIIGDDGVSSFFRYGNSEIYFYASPTGKFTVSDYKIDIFFPESGLYALNLGVMGAEIDMVLELVNAPSTGGSDGQVAL
jgi:hypothetical protein